MELIVENQQSQQDQNQAGQQPPVQQPNIHISLNQQPMMQPGVQQPTYVRAQKGHSIVKHVCLIFLFGVGLITITYYSISPNHYWHL